MVKTNLQCLANEAEIDFEWELLTVIRRKQINIYWWQFELVIPARSKCNYCWSIDMGVIWSSLFSFVLSNCFCKIFAASAFTSFFFCSLSDGWNERTDQTITKSHIYSGGFGQMGDGNSYWAQCLSSSYHMKFIIYSALYFCCSFFCFFYSNDSFHSRFDKIWWRRKSYQSSTSFDIQFAISLCSSHISACYPHYHHCQNGFCSLVLLAKPKIYFPSSLEIFDCMNNALWKVFNLYINIKIGKIYFMCTYSFIIYKELGTLKSIMPLWQSLQPVFPPYFLWNQWTLLNIWKLSLLFLAE